MLTVKGVSSDSRAIEPDDLFIAVRGDRLDGHDFVASAFARGATAAIVSRTLSPPPEFRDRQLYKVPDTVEAYGRLARYYRRRWGGKVIAVTGSNGKTTTREMLAHLLSARHALVQSLKNFNNHIGVPQTLFQAHREHALAVVEMGTSSPGEIAYLARVAEPDYAVITNVGESHLEKLVSLQGVARAKGELLDAMDGRGVAFLNADDPWHAALAGRRRGKTVTFGRSPPADVRCVHEEAWQGGSRFRLATGQEFVLPVPGRHNVSNALASLAVCHELGCLDRAAERLATFDPPEMRFNVERVRDVTLIADCYNANPLSMAAALEAMDAMPCGGRRVMVCGDMLEMGRHVEETHRGLGRRVGASRIDCLFTVGASSRWVAEAAKESRDLTWDHFERAEDAAAPVAAWLRPDDLVLVKGSRALRLEGVLQAVRERFGEARQDSPTAPAKGA